MSRLDASPAVGPGANGTQSALSRRQRARLEKVDGFIFDIQRYSLHDGPGLRTNVFMKGCPLHCPWCANPESQRSQPELVVFEQHCIACGQFDPACPNVWNSNGHRSQLTLEEYEQRVAACPTCAIRWIGQRRTAGEVMEEVLRDAPFYGEVGGMTLTGGEPTMQPAMAEALLRLAKAEGVSTAMETCGHISWKVLARLTPHLDVILYDLKHTDSDKHREFTGVDNELILSNLRRLAAEKVPVRVRVPLIPGFNATPEAMAATARFVKALAGPVLAIDVLPYHTMARSKYQALGRDYGWEGHDRLSETEVRALVAVLETSGLPVAIGG